VHGDTAKEIDFRGVVVYQFGSVLADGQMLSVSQPALNRSFSEDTQNMRMLSDAEEDPSRR
jgi:hypothetical protein